MEHQQQAQGNLAYVNALIERLRDLQLDGTALPDADDTQFTLAAFYRLRRHLLAEGYGQATQQ
jgi:hypothetical protein